MGKNKPRHKFDADGKPHITMCSCGFMNCDPQLHGNSIYKEKIYNRKCLGLCPGCGKKECRCKNKKAH